MELEDRIRRQWRRALDSGDLRRIQTDVHWIEDGGVRFRVHLIRGTDDKHRTTRAQRQDGVDPFLPPYDDDLFVADLSNTHVALLNKFPALEHHLLVVTRAFEPQQSALTLSDFQALSICTRQLEGLAFYNGGHAAGASQPHKHLQLVSASLTTESLLDGGGGFACARAAIARPHDPQSILDAYRQLLAEMALEPEAEPYNLLLSTDWMALIPRSRHAWEGFATNAMGYAGSFLVRTKPDLERLRALGPLRVLREVGRTG